MLVKILYVLLLLISVVNLFILAAVMKKRKSGYYSLLFLLTSIVCASYLMVSVSSNEWEALTATKFTYLGGTYLVLVLIICLCQICGIPYKLRWFIPLFLLDTEVLTVVGMAGHNDWHYKSIELHQEQGFTYLTKVYGWNHNVYLVAVAISALLVVGVMGHALYHRKKTSWIYTMEFAISLFAVLGMYILSRVLKLRIELPAIGFVAVEIVILNIVRRMSIYDVEQNAELSRMYTYDHGYAIIDIAGRFVGADEIARFYFPELNEQPLDRMVEQPFLNREFRDWITLSKYEEVSPKFYTREGRDVKVTVNPFYNASGKKKLGFVLQILDDSQAQKYIRSLKEANLQAEEEAAKADAANKSKSDFLSNMSHEIRTPINAVLGLNEMILRESDDANIKSYAQDIDSAGHTLLGLINDLLDFSKIEAGKMNLVPAKYSTVSALNDIANMIGIRAEDKGLAFVMEIDPQLPKALYGDDVRIKQILTNLLTNAVKYTEKGTVTLTITCKPSGEGYVNLDISVKDTGIGMKKEALEKAFKPFERVDEEHNRNIEGTGLGLALTQQLLRLMSSRLNVKSEYGKGSEFSCTIRQQIEDATPIGDFKEARSSLHSRSESYQALLKAPRAKVLVVDDTKVNVRVFVGLVKQTQIQVNGAFSGADAVNLCKKNVYDIIYMDHMMPEMDGVEAMKHIREDEDSLNKDTKVIVMTANAIAGAREKYLEVGFDDYISKPINPDRLEQSLLDYIPEDKIE